MKSTRQVCDEWQCSKPAVAKTVREGHVGERKFCNEHLSKKISKYPLSAKPI